MSATPGGTLSSLAAKLAAGNGLPALTQLGGLARTDFLSNPSGPGATGVGTITTGGPTYTGTVVGPGTTGTTGATGSTGTATISAAGCQPAWSNLWCLFSGSAGVLGDQLLRIVFLLLGLIAIIGAIYLYKPTSGLVTGPVKLVKGAVKAVAQSAAQGEE